MAKKDIDLYERIASLEMEIKNYRLTTEEKINEIHKKLVGNGKPGLVDEFNIFKGFTKGFAYSFSFLLLILTIYVTVVK